MSQAWPFVLSGLVFGFSGGIAPGPLLALTISETLRGGLGAGFRVCLAPIITDGPLILVTFFLLSRLGDLDILMGLISFLGGSFLLFLAFESWRTNPDNLHLEADANQALKRGVLTNLLNPSPYLFWVSVGTPTLLDANDHGPFAIPLFLLAFFASIVCSKLAVAMLTARFSDFLRSRFYLALMRFLALALLVFALLFYWDAGQFFGLF